MVNLQELGFSPFFAAQSAAFESEGLVPARVISDARTVFELAGANATLGELSGRRHHALSEEERPATGDWVMVEDQGPRAVIHHVLARNTAIRRRAAGTRVRLQTVAANVDICFIVTAANLELKARRLERYLTVVWDSGAQPIIVLNKIDLVTNLDQWLAPIRDVARATKVIGVSAREGAGLAELESHIERGKTICFVGSSGVGKSTLVNRLSGRAEALTAAIGWEDRGRHTTTARDLLVLERGGILIDTPGMRELGLVTDDGGLDATFDDVARAAAGCRFHDCSHGHEPGCDVRAQVASGALAPERAQAYLDLGREIANASAQRNSDPSDNSKRRWKAIHRGMRAFSKTNPKRRD